MKKSIPNLKFNSGIHNKQLDVLRAFDSGRKRFFMLKWHRRARKTTLLLNILIRESLRHPKSMYVYVGPTYTQAKSIVWRDPNMLFDYLPDRSICPWKPNEAELFIKFPNGSVLSIRGGDDPDSLRGINARGVGFDEWALMKRKIWTEIFRPIIAENPNRWAMFNYTPKGQNHATEMWREAENWDDWYLSTLRASESGLLSQDELDKARREMTPAMYEQEFECAEFADEEFTLITSRLIEGLRGITRIGVETKKLVSCDPDSSVSGDECVIYAFENTELIDEQVMHERDTMKIGAAVHLMGQKHNIFSFAVDTIGVGQGVVDYLSKFAQNNVIPFDSRQTALEPKRFANRRAESWWYVMQQMMDLEVQYPELKGKPSSSLMLRQDLSSTCIKPLGFRGRIILEEKLQTKKRLGRSPDRGDAFIIGIYSLQFIQPEVIRTMRRQEKTNLAESYTVESVL